MSGDTDERSSENADETALQVETGSASSSHKKFWLMAAGAVLTIVAVAITIAVPTILGANARGQFKAAVADCELTGNSSVSFGDDGKTLIVDGKGGDDAEGLDVADEACILLGLNTPDSTIARMDSTRALDGVQSDEFDGITVRWSYHPDNGLDLIFSR